MGDPELPQLPLLAATAAPDVLVLPKREGEEEVAARGWCGRRRRRRGDLLSHSLGRVSNMKQCKGEEKEGEREPQPWSRWERGRKAGGGLPN